MRPEERSLDRAFQFLDESHRRLVADATRVFSLAEEYSETNYSSELHTTELYATDKQVEDRIEGYWQDMQDSIQEMDAALTQIDEKIHETQSKDLGLGQYIDMVEKKRWYGEKYNQLMDELAQIQATPLIDKTTENNPRIDYERPQDDFQIEKGQMPEIKRDFRA